MLIQSINQFFIVSFTVFEFVSAFALNPLYVVVSKILPDEIKGIGINLVDFIGNLTFLALPMLELIAAEFGMYATLIPAIVLTLFAGICSSILYLLGSDMKHYL